MISPFLQKLMFVRQFGINNGEISLLGERHVLFDAFALLEIQKIDKTKLYEALRKTSFKNISEAVEHAKVYENVRNVFVRDIARLGKKMGKTDAGMMKTLQELFNIYGLGELQIIKLDNDKKEVLLRLRNSSIAKEYLKNYKKSSTPVDMIAAGVLAGMFSFVFNKNVECVEQKCIAQGGSYCEFRVA